MSSLFQSNVILMGLNGGTGKMKFGLEPPPWENIMLKRSVNLESEKTGGTHADPGNVLIFIYIACVVCFLLLGSFSRASAEVVPTESQTISFDDLQRGELLVPAKEAGRFTPSPLLGQQVRISVNGITAKAVVRQEFANGSDQWIEAVYAFPLPDESAVERLRMHVGERIIEGEIKEKKEARRIYEQARSEGKKSSLLVQKRPNIFTTSIANIGPGESVVVEIEYQQVVRFADNVFSLRFPMVIAPRYIPGTPLAVEQDVQLSFGGGGWALDTDQVPDASHITPHVKKPGRKSINPIQLSLELNPGFSPARVESLYHGMEKEEKGKGVYDLSFNGEVKADRDFVLEWEPEKERELSGALFSEEKGGNHYMLLMVMPPEKKSGTEYLPREMIFVLDTSGSMAGTSILQAKKALMLAISRLRPGDRFNVIEFNSRARSLFPSPRFADPVNTDRALRFVEGLKADGGTEMAKALHLALNSRNDSERLRQVVFLTDGSVGNEERLFELIHNRLGDSRLFTLGIGSAPNSFFMTRAASMGRGAFTYIGKVEEVQEKMTDLFQKLEHPVLTGLRLSVEEPESVQLEVFPKPLPDLYAGEPLVVTMKTEEPLNGLTLRGTRAGQSWNMKIDTRDHGNREGVATLWARKKIRNEMEALHLGADSEAVRKSVLATALEHHLVSKYTSLVAVEKKVSRPAGEKLVRKDQKTNLPHGWQYDKVFGGASQTATPATLHLIVGLCLMLLAFLFLRMRPLKRV